MATTDGSTVEISIRALNQRGFRILGHICATVSPAEVVKIGEAATGSDFEGNATTQRSPAVGRAVELAIGGEHQPSDNIISIGATAFSAKTVQHRHHSFLRDSKDRAVVVGSPKRGCPVIIAVDALNERHRIGAVSVISAEINEVCERLRVRPNRRRSARHEHGAGFPPPAKIAHTYPLFRRWQFTPKWSGKK